MRELKIILLLGFWLLLPACSDHFILNSSRWSLDGPAPSRPRDLDQKDQGMSIGTRRLLLQTQKIDGVEVEDSFYKEISSSTPEFISANWAEKIPTGLRARLLYMKAGKTKVIPRFFAKHPEMASVGKAPTVQLVIVKGEPRWRMSLPTADGRLMGIYLNSSLEIESSHYLGSGLENAAATLFPEGPILSQLQKVWLANLTDNRSLSSFAVRVTTQSNQAAVAENAQFVFPVDDRRFEQVQAFFYLSKVVDWVQKTLHFSIPFVLEAETSVGFPDKTNTAFYYDHRIRLGDGDDEVFSRIPLDPSIVFHESFHSVIDAVAKLPFEGEGGSLNEGIADFFTSMLNDNPNLGEASYKKAPYKRTVKNTLVLSDKNGGLYHDSGIISGLLWSLQESLGREVGTQLAWQILLRLTPASDFHNFYQELNVEASKLSAEQQGKVQAILQKRGWAE